MTTTCQIPETVRELFESAPSIDEHPEFFSEPTKYMLSVDHRERLAAVRQIGSSASIAISLDPAFRFTLEAQLEGLAEILDVVAEKRPEMFRQTERGRDLLDNLHILMNGGALV